MFYTDASAAGANLVATALSGIENLYVQNVAGTTTAGTKETVTLVFSAVTGTTTVASTVTIDSTAVAIAALGVTATAIEVAQKVASTAFTNFVVKSLDGATVVLEAKVVGDLANLTQPTTVATGGVFTAPTMAIINGTAAVTTAVTQTVDATTLTDTVQFWNNASTGAVTFDSIQQAATIGVKGVTAGANATTTANFATAMTTGTADSVSIALDGNTSAGTITIGAGFETVNVSAAGKNTVAELDTGAKTVNITGAGDLTITATIAGATKIDGSTATGKLTLTSAVAKVDIDTGTGADKVTVNTASEFSVNTGAGNDTVVLGHTTVAGLADGKVTVDGGAGTDTLEITAALGTVLSALPAADLAKKGISNFEKLTISDALDNQTINVERLGLNSDITLKGGTVNNGSTLSNVANGGTVTLGAAAAVALTINVKDAAVAGSNSDVLNVAFAGAHDGATITTFEVIAANVETVNLVSSTSKATPLVTADTNTLTTLTTVGAEAIKISGDVAFIITDALGTTFTALKSINASENTAGVTLSADNVVQGVSITGTAKADTITGGDGNDVINGGAGNDVIVGGLGNDVINGGDGDDTITGSAGADTLTGGAGADIFNFDIAEADNIGAANSNKITDFVAGTDKLQFGTDAGDVFATITATSVSLGIEATITSAVNSLADVITAIGSNTAVTVGAVLGAKVYTFTTGSAAGKYLHINDDGTAVADAADIFVNLTGISGTLSATDFTFV